MKLIRFMSYVSLLSLVFSLTNFAQAGRPLWTFAVVPGYAPEVTVSVWFGKATIKYIVTNESRKSHTLKMKPIQGITASGCNTPLSYHQSCILTLEVHGEALRGEVIGGPALCEQTSPNQCYQPSKSNALAIRLTQALPEYEVLTSANANGTISPSGTQIVTRGTTLTLTAIPDAGYKVSQWVIDGVLVQTGGNTYSLNNVIDNHVVEVSFNTVTLVPSLSSLTLSINCQPSSSCDTVQHAALTGHPRQIIVENIGDRNATNLSINAPDLPAGTSINAGTCTGTLLAGHSCTMSITPGAVASSDLSGNACTAGTEPVASTVTITADGDYSTSVSVYVLGYGCQYQGGFLFAVDDTTPNTDNIGGHVVSLSDQQPAYIAPEQEALGVVWSSNGGPSGPLFRSTENGSYDIIPGVGHRVSPEPSRPTEEEFNAFFENTYTNLNPFPSGFFSMCNGESDGACNTANIVAFYNQLITNNTWVDGGSPPFTASEGPTDLTYYAAGACKSIINGYSDWYLPALCEFNAVAGWFTCDPNLQNISKNLPFLIGYGISNESGVLAPSATSCSPPEGTSCLVGSYWSSTLTPEDRLPDRNAGEVIFDLNHANPSRRGFSGKEFRRGIRCARALTF